MQRRMLALALALTSACSFDTTGLAIDDLAIRDRSAVEPRGVDGGAADGGQADRTALVDTLPDLVPDLAPDLACPGGATRSCYTGPAGTLGKGNCKAGTASCSGGSWGPCQGETLPKQEECDGEDDNCDGLVDEGLTEECAYSGPGSTQNVGLCKAGSRSCSNGAWGSCTGEVTPTNEGCDKQDNDCDGQTDEGFTIKCESLACTGSGKIKTISNTCVADDGGTTASSDELEVYCCAGIARFCLSKEACPWRAGCGTTPGAATCSPAGLTSDFMAKVSCSAWNGHALYHCTAAGEIYFAP